MVQVVRRLLHKGADIGVVDVDEMTAAMLASVCQQDHCTTFINTCECVFLYLSVCPSVCLCTHVATSVRHHSTDWSNENCTFLLVKILQQISYSKTVFTEMFRKIRNTRLICSVCSQFS